MTESKGSKVSLLALQILKGLGVIALLVILMMWLAGAFTEKVRPSPPLPREVPKGPYRTKRVELRTFPLFIEQVGTVRSEAEAKVSSRIMAQVVDILVGEGQPVQGPRGSHEKGTVLAKLDDRDIRARLQQTQAQVRSVEKAIEAARARLAEARARLEAAIARLKLATQDYNRYLELYKRQAATGQQLDRARTEKTQALSQVKAARESIAATEGHIESLEAKLMQARAAVEESRVLLSFTVVRAPFSGRVIRKLVEVGDTVRPGQPMFILERPFRPELHATVSESLIAHISVGQKLQVIIDALNFELEGRVREIIPRADPRSRTLLVKVALTHVNGLVSGLFGRIRIPYGQYKALVIPSKAVREVGQLHLVMVMDEKRGPVRRFVTLGQTHDGLVEVLSGLKEGEEVVLP
jgi:multidrug resistance efflux pump